MADTPALQVEDKRPRFAQVDAAAIADPRLTHALFRLLAALALHADSVTRCCHPSRRRLADILGLRAATGVGTISKMLRALRQLGYLEITVKPNRAGSLYRLLQPQGWHPSEVAPATGATHHGYEVAPTTGATVTPTTGASVAPATGAQNTPLNTPSELTTEHTIPAGPPEVVEVKRKPGNFEAVWHAYPRQIDKPGARTAYLRACARGASPALILAGARRVAGETSAAGTAKTMIPALARWLTAEGWAEPPGERFAPQESRKPAGPSDGAAILESQMFGGLS